MRFIVLGMPFRSWLLNTTCFVTPHQLRQVAIPDSIMKQVRDSGNR